MSSTTVDLALPARASRAEREFKPKSKVGPIGIAVMVAFHLGVGYVLVSGLGRHAVELVKKPLDATIIEEVKLPPPPPPPPKPIVKQEMPKVETPPPAYVPPPEVAPPPDAPSPIAAVQNAVPEAPPPAAPAAPVATPQPATNDIAVACPKQTRPVPPQKALDAGISGTVRAEARIHAGKVVDVRMLSGPKVYYAAVRAAMMQYECASNTSDVVAQQEFEFKVE